MKKIVILGSTGSIGENTLEIIKKDKKILKLFCFQQIETLIRFLIKQKNLKSKI